MTPAVRRLIGVLLCTLLAYPAPAWPERMQPIGAYEAHYSLVPTTMLKARVAAGYGISRARDRALLTLSILGPDGKPVQAAVAGTVKDLLGQERALELREVTEGEAVYYLSEVRHSDREVLRFAIEIQTPDARVHELSFQQKMYWEEG